MQDSRHSGNSADVACARLRRRGPAFPASYRQTGLCSHPDGNIRQHSSPPQLADQGVTEHWSIAEDDRDTLRVASADGLPDVSLKMFRSERGAVAAFRTEEDDGECVSELWYISAGGHAAPLPLPPEPAVDDFFRPDRDLPGRISSSCTYCVFDRGLEVLPSFASDGFPCELEPDNAVYYLWNGRTFVKKIKKLR